MRRDAWRIALAAGLLAGAACEGPGLASTPLAVGPLDDFAHEVEPVLEARCAQGGCHGRADRPFSLYAPGQLRADPRRTHLAEPLTEGEVAVNARRIAALAVPGSTDDSPALRKPLALSAGGSYHGGGDVFVDRTDPGYRALRSWLLACERGGDAGAPDAGSSGGAP
jgi:hypothetical protein